MNKALAITTPDSCTAVEQQLIRAVIKSHYQSLATVAAVFYNQGGEIPAEAEEVLFQHTIEFARECFPGTTVEEDKRADNYGSTVIDALKDIQ